LNLSVFFELVLAGFISALIGVFVAIYGAKHLGSGVAFCAIFSLSFVLLEWWVFSWSYKEDLARTLLGRAMFMIMAGVVWAVVGLVVVWLLGAGYSFI
jgi:hypothetical protein